MIYLLFAVTVMSHDVKVMKQYEFCENHVISLSFNQFLAYAGFERIEITRKMVYSLRLN